MSIGQNIKKYRLLRGYTLDEVARKIGVSRQTMSRYETGVIANIPSDKIEAIAKALDISPALLMNWTTVWEKDNYDDFYRAKTDDERREILQLFGIPSDLRSYAEQLLSQSPSIPSNAIPYSPANQVAPILGRIPAGYPLFSSSEIEGYAPIDYADTENYFWLRVSGDSMVNADILNGDLVLIRRQPCADDGQIVAARVNGDEATLKRFRRVGDTVMLMPENPSYSPIPVPVSAFETGDASIIGVVVELKRKFV